MVFFRMKNENAVAQVVKNKKLITRVSKLMSIILEKRGREEQGMQLF